MTAGTATSTAADRVLAALRREGVDFATGVPCSLLAGLFSVLERGGPGERIRYVPAPREDTAMGMAVGARLAGAMPVVLMQNSGLGYCLNVLTSLTLIYDVHPLIIMSWRGHDGTDAVEHDVIGREVVRLLDVVGIAHAVLDPERPERAVASGMDAVRDAQPFVVLVVEGI
ncbi:thiamine pyrophosphate-binding protein [Clavibacter sp. CT19]|uniref:thiamine pyrophosphate-binding protein n=1 Tax=Clavibacter sp. CT19 TaxID=3018990 RepID=UPI0022EB060C|nr:thiamine pyrophosphate-binding protein [Clavibacter sp. CT19]MDA3805924.1 thiamine pyrophosphate-binding protein [Clavibacter sp. CT19]